MSREDEFKRELAKAVNRCSMERDAGDTHDFIAADFMATCLGAMGDAIRARDNQRAYPLLTREDAARRLSDAIMSTAVTLGKQRHVSRDEEGKGVTFITGRQAAIEYILAALFPPPATAQDEDTR